MKYLLAAILACLPVLFSKAQDVEYARCVLEKLADPSLSGRGYVKKGDRKAAEFIAGEFKNNHLIPLSDGYFQSYTFPMNTFPGKISLSIDGQQLIPGYDYVISSSAPSVNQRFNIVDLSTAGLPWDSLRQLMQKSTEHTLFLLDEKGVKKEYGAGFKHIEAVALLTEAIPGWHVSNGGKVQETLWLKIRHGKVPKEAKQLRIKAKNKFISEYHTQNVVAMVSGKTDPDSFVVFSAHYDHLGMMGKEAMFPGANDNGSGTAMLLDLSRYFALAENQPEVSMVFLAFSGEEAGLHGANYFADHPLIPLENIKVFINLDMVGTGSEGITVVNGQVLPDIFNRLEAINAANKYLPEVTSRGESCNSDHCPFYKKGVPAIFIYTRGKENQHYHTVTDTAEGYPFTKYTGLFNLLTDFVTAY